MLFKIHTHNGTIITDEVGLTDYIKFELEEKEIYTNTTPKIIIENVKKYSESGRLYPFLRDSIEVKI